jgi:RNA-binding protein
MIKPATPATPAAPAELSERQKRHLRGLAHALEPVVRVGHAGVSGALLEELGRALHDHELVKVKVPGGDRAARAQLIEQLAAGSGSALVQRIGNVAVFYRPRAESPRILIPGA